jgi:hypothetical protein
MDQNKAGAAMFEAFKDLSIAITSFLLASYLTNFIEGRVFAAFDGQTAFYMSLIPMGALLLSLLGFYRRGA